MSQGWLLHVFFVSCLSVLGRCRWVVLLLLVVVVRDQVLQRLVALFLLRL